MGAGVSAHRSDRDGGAGDMELGRVEEVRDCVVGGTRHPARRQFLRRTDPIDRERTAMNIGNVQSAFVAVAAVLRSAGVQWTGIQLFSAACDRFWGVRTDLRGVIIKV